MEGTPRPTPESAWDASNAALGGASNTGRVTGHWRERLAAWRRRWPAVLVLSIVCIVLAVQHAHKASEDRSAFIRWRAALLGITAGAEIYGAGYQYPNPPIMALVLWPLAQLPDLVGTMTWFFVKLALTVLAAAWTFQLVRDKNRPLAGWAALLTVGLAARPIMSDLSHGNVNLFILFLVVASLRAYRAGWDRTSGLAVALATACKVTPALLCVYWLYKRAWRVTTWSAIGLVLFLAVIPSLVLGPATNVKLFGDWLDLMVYPYVVEGEITAEQINQSIPGVMTRLLTDVKSVEAGAGPPRAINVASLDPWVVRLLIRGACLAVVIVLVVLCRTPTDRRDRWRLSCEYGLVLLAMLFLSERSWKHHYVVLLVPYGALCYALAAPTLSRRWKWYLGGTLAASALLMATTSSELGEAMFGPWGHKYAQGYGAFLMAGLVLFAALAVLLWRGPQELTGQDESRKGSTTESRTRQFHRDHRITAARSARTRASAGRHNRSAAE